MNVSRTYNYESDLTVYPANRVASMSVVLKILSKMVSLVIFTLYCGQLFVALLYRAARQTRVTLREMKEDKYICKEPGKESGL